MKRLSEIPMDEYIAVEGAEDIITKEDYLRDKEDVQLYETSKTVVRVDWDEIVECFEDDQYEEWGLYVSDEIKTNIKLQKAIKTINEVFERYPTYRVGDRIDNDLLEGGEGIWNGYQKN